MLETIKRTTLSVALLLYVSGERQALTPGSFRRSDEARPPQSVTFATTGGALNESSRPSLLRIRSEQCASSPVSLRLLIEYGGMFAADTRKVLLPSNCLFQNEAEVLRFQRRAGSSSVVVNGIRVELQPQALKAYLAARNEARKQGVDITPRGADASRRSYAETTDLWGGRVEAALSYWVGRGKLTKPEAARLRSLAPAKQVAEVLELEKKRIYFGSGFGRPILQSVAAPGSSQHNVMLALDVEQHNNSLVRAILANHGWFQTVKNDAPHFTFLGVKESALPALDLQPVSSGGRTFWVPAIKIDSNPSLVKKTEEDKDHRPASNRKNGTAKSESKKENADSSNTRLTEPTSMSKNRIYATINPGVLLPVEMEKRLRLLTQRYYERTGLKLHVTSGYRTPERQARAIYDNLVAYQTAYVLDLYRGSAAIREIVNAYGAHPRSPQQALREMVKVIQAQVRRGVYISAHMLGQAFDIRSRGPNGARLSVLREVARSMGGYVSEERNHYHVEF
jgi:uncharacterized protein YcbK (DUF882 family)